MKDKKLINRLDRFIDVHKSRMQNDYKEFRPAYEKEIAMLTEIKGILGKHEKLIDDFVGLTVKYQDLKESLSKFPDDLVEKITNVGESLGVRLGNPVPQIGAIYKEERAEAIAEIHKLLKQGQLEKVRVTQIEIRDLLADLESTRGILDYSNEGYHSAKKHIIDLFKSKGVEVGEK